MDSDKCDRYETKSQDGSEHSSDRNFIAAEGSVGTEVTTIPSNPQKVDTLETHAPDQVGSGVPNIVCRLLKVEISLPKVYSITLLAIKVNKVLNRRSISLSVCNTAHA